MTSRLERACDCEARPVAGNHVGVRAHINVDRVIVSTHESKHCMKCTGVDAGVDTLLIQQNN